MISSHIESRARKTDEARVNPLSRRYDVARGIEGAERAVDNRRISI